MYTEWNPRGGLRLPKLNGLFPAGHRTDANEQKPFDLGKVIEMAIGIASPDSFSRFLAVLGAHFVLSPLLGGKRFPQGKINYSQDLGQLKRALRISPGIVAATCTIVWIDSLNRGLGIAQDGEYPVDHH